MIFGVINAYINNTNMSSEMDLYFFERIPIFYFYCNIYLYICQYFLINYTDMNKNPHRLKICAEYKTYTNS